MLRCTLSSATRASRLKSRVAKYASLHTSILFERKVWNSSADAMNLHLVITFHIYPPYVAHGIAAPPQPYPALTTSGTQSVNTCCCALKR